MRNWHPAAVMLVGMTASGVAGMWAFAYLNGDLKLRDFLATGAAMWQARLLLRIQRGEP